jgi:hypothetical protein
MARTQSQSQARAQEVPAQAQAPVNADATSAQEVPAQAQEVPATGTDATSAQEAPATGSASATGTDATSADLATDAEPSQEDKTLAEVADADADVVMPVLSALGTLASAPLPEYVPTDANLRAVSALPEHVTDRILANRTDAKYAPILAGWVATATMLHEPDADAVADAYAKLHDAFRLYLRARRGIVPVPASADLATDATSATSATGTKKGKTSGWGHWATLCGNKFNQQCSKLLGLPESHLTDARKALWPDETPEVESRSVPANRSALAMCGLVGLDVPAPVLQAWRTHGQGMEPSGQADAYLANIANFTGTKKVMPSWPVMPV